MNVHEPMTVATDYLLAIFAAAFATRLWRAGARSWACAFAATAAASLLGGTYHGLAYAPLWKPTMYAVGLASLFLLAGLGRVLAAAGLVKFVIYATWIWTHDDFKDAIYDYASPLVVVAVVAAIRKNAWIVGGVAVSAIAALVQQSGFALHRHFNHNDLYHVIQIVALWMLHRGGLLLTTTSTTRSTSRPT